MFPGYDRFAPCAARENTAFSTCAKVKIDLWISSPESIATKGVDIFIPIYALILKDISGKVAATNERN